jgi:hypothetical protein
LGWDSTAAVIPGDSGFSEDSWESAENAEARRTKERLRSERILIEPRIRLRASGRSQPRYGTMSGDITVMVWMRRPDGTYCTCIENVSRSQRSHGPTLPTLGIETAGPSARATEDVLHGRGRHQERDARESGPANGS